MPANLQITSPSGYHPHPSPLRYIRQPVPASKAAAGIDGEGGDVRYMHRSGIRRISELSCQALWGMVHGAAGGQGMVPAVAATLQECCVLAVSALRGAAGESHKSSST